MFTLFILLFRLTYNYSYVNEFAFNIKTVLCVFSEMYLMYDQIDSIAANCSSNILNAKSTLFCAKFKLSKYMT